MREESSSPNPKGIVKSKFRKECVFPKCYTSCTKLSGLSKAKFKIAIQVPKTHIYTLFRVLSTTTPASLAIKRKLRKTLEKVLIILKCISPSYMYKIFFTSLERTSIFIISLFRAISRSSSPDAFTKKGVLLQLRSMFRGEYPCRTFAWIFSCKLSKYL